ncbi:four helix bundle protein [Candidatus Uhrbacteria bacterium]|nr:four helix bundle protein [Candidatus Uhrbacteria bacterium]
MAQISTFRDLQVWQKAHQLVVEVYRLTAKFPPHEMYGLVSQLRRAALSVASNIVEGFHRKSVYDSLHFYNIADASLEEVRYQLMVACELGYIDKAQYTSIEALGGEVSKKLRRWIQSQKDNTHQLSKSGETSKSSKSSI